MNGVGLVHHVNFKSISRVSSPLCAIMAENTPKKIFIEVYVMNRFPPRKILAYVTVGSVNLVRCKFEKSVSLKVGEKW